MISNRFSYDFKRSKCINKKRSRIIPHLVIRGERKFTIKLFRTSIISKRIVYEKSEQLIKLKRHKTLKRDLSLIAFQFKFHIDFTDFLSFFFFF